MTSIERVEGGPAAPRLAARGAPPDGAAFASALEARAGQGADPTAAVVEPMALGAMLALQEMGTGSVRDRAARRRGQDLLAALATLQRDLLAGGDDPAAVRHLADLAAAVPEAEDRRVGAVLAAIVLRARVELTRRGG